MFKLIYHWLASIVILLSLLTIGVELAPKKCEIAIPIEISTCDFMGYCAILDSSNNIQIARYPILNVPSKYNCEVDWDSIKL